MTNKYDFLILGGGITGLCVSNQLRQRYPKAQILVVEKESKLGMHSSGRNSGVLHAGIYYPEGSIKARVCVNGAKRLKSWVIQNKLSINPCGKIIVAQNKEVESQIESLASRAKSNRVIFSLIDAKAIRKKVPGINPDISVGIWSPNTCVVNPIEVIQTLSKELTENGIRIKTSAKILGINVESSEINLNGEYIRYGHIFNCAGLHADSIAHKYGVGGKYKILPFKGLYWNLKEKSAFNTPVNLYPVPDLNVPFLGVHFTPNTESTPQFTIGPTATPALGRENYRWFQNIEPKTALFTITTIAKQYLMNKNNFRKYVHQQAPLALPPFLLKSARELIPSIQEKDLSLSSKVGIRSQLYNLEYEALENDFLCIQQENSTHVLNAISPAFTASFELADLIIKQSGY